MYYCMICGLESHDRERYVGDAEHVGMGPDVCIPCFVKHGHEGVRRAQREHGITPEDYLGQYNDQDL